MNVFEVMINEREWIKVKQIRTFIIGSLGLKQLYFNNNRFDYFDDDFTFAYIDNRIKDFLKSKNVEYIEWIEKTNSLYFCIEQ